MMVWKVVAFVSDVQSLLVDTLILRCLAAVYVFTTKEPKRGLKEKSLEHVDHDEDTLHTISWGKFKNLFSRPTFLLILLQGLTGIFPWG